MFKGPSPYDDIRESDRRDRCRDSLEDMLRFDQELRDRLAEKASVAATHLDALSEWEVERMMGYHQSLQEEGKR